MAAIECCCYFYPIKHKFGQTQQPAREMNLTGGPQSSSSCSSSSSSSSSSSPASFEEIELKCYSLPDNRLLLDSDRRFRLQDPRGLVRSRLIEGFDEARHLLDSRRPDSCSLIRLKVDQKSGQVEERLSIVELATTSGHLDDVALFCDGPPIERAQEATQLAVRDERVKEEEEDDKGDKNTTRLAELSRSEVNLIERKRQREKQIVDRLSSRSFVLVERSSTLAVDWLQQLPAGQSNEGQQLADQNHKQTDDFDESWRSINSITVINQPQSNLEESTKLRDDFLSSISIETSALAATSTTAATTSAKVAEEAKEAVDKSKMRVSTRIRKSLSRKLNRFLFGSSSGDTKHRQQVRASGECKQIKYSNLIQQQEQSINGLTCQSSRRDEVADDREDEEDDDGHHTSRDRWQLVEHKSRETTRHELSVSHIKSASDHLAINKRPARKLIAMISYNHNEAQDYAKCLHAALEAHGISTYLDVFEIRKGADWQDSLNLAILNCRLFIPLITPSYGETLWTRRELKLADVLSKLIIPINFLGPSDWPPKSLAIQFATIQYISWLSSGEAGQATSAAPAHPAGWPAECVQSIARQIRQTIELDLLDEFQSIVAENQRQVGQSRANSSSSSCSSSSSSGASTTSCSSSSSSSSCCSSAPRPDRRPRTQTNELVQQQLDSGYDSPETTGLLVGRKSLKLPLLRLDGQPMAAANYYGSLPESPTRSHESYSPNEPSTGNEPRADFRPRLQAPEKPVVRQVTSATKSAKAKRKNSIGGRALGALSKIKRTFKSK